MHPLSESGRLFTSFLIITSFGTFAYALTSLSKYVIDGEFNHYFKNYKVNSAIQQLHDHIIICGYGRNGRQAAQVLKNDIDDLNTSVTTTIQNALANPFYVMDKGAKDLDKTILNVTKNYKAFTKLTAEQVGTFLPTQKPDSPVAPAAPQGLLSRGPSQAIVEAAAISEAASEQAKFNYLLNEAASTANFLAQGVGNMFQAIAQGENVGDAVLNVFKDMALQLAQMVVQALIFKAIMSALGMGSVAGGVGDAGGGLFGGLGKLFGFADGGIVSKPTFAMVGEGGESEAIMPLSKLDKALGGAFASGASQGKDTASQGSFVLRGNDLVLAMQRSNYSLNLRRGV